MAKLIKDTPVLRGKDAKRFTEAIKRNESSPVSRKEYARAKDNYNAIKKSVAKND